MPQNTRLTVREWMRQEDLTTDTLVEYLHRHEYENGTCPALCTENCEVEPDGVCPHGNPSVLRALGLI